MKLEEPQVYEIDININGDDTSLWGKSEGLFKINKLEIEYDDDDGFASINLYGPHTNNGHYTDKLILKEVNEKCTELISEKLGRIVTEISWSEGGLQPENGWNFDVNYI